MHKENRVKMRKKTAVKEFSDNIIRGAIIVVESSGKEECLRIDSYQKEEGNKDAKSSRSRN